MTVISRRPPVLARILGVAFFAGVSAWIVAANVGDYLSGHASAWVFVPVAAMVLILMAFACRAVTQSFRADGAGVVIHNILRTHRIPVTEIVGFDVGARFQLARNAVRVVTQSSAIPIGAYGRWADLFLDIPSEIADELEDWLEDARAGLAT